jgi:nicotinic acetylcholine receptor
MIYKSYCAINIEYYPFDTQDCYMKFGTWSLDGNAVELEHININNSVPVKDLHIPEDGSSTKVYTVDFGIDMSDYYPSVEWDVLSIPAQKNIKLYPYGPYYDIYYNITIRRKPLFYTINLIIPCVNISFLSILVFFLPCDCGEKLTLGISILVALLVFYLLLIDLVPPTSIVIPLVGKYLLFTLILVNLSILLTILIVNLHHRKPKTDIMPKWMKWLFIDKLPKYLLIERPLQPPQNGSNDAKPSDKSLERPYQSFPDFNQIYKQTSVSNDKISVKKSKNYPVNIKAALNGLRYMNNKVEKEDRDQKVWF